MKYCNAEVLNKIDKYIELHKEDILNDLLELVRIPSVRGEAKPDAPYGIECARMVNATAKLFEHNGFETKINNGDGYALSYYGTGEKSIGVFVHGDVVPADGEWQVCSPFEPVIKDGYIFGRGCNDDKSGVAGMLYATKMIKDLKLDFSSRLVMFTGSNEEAGMEDIISFVENEEMPYISLIPDAHYPCVYGERSIIHFEITSKEPFKKITKFHGGNASNIVLGEVETNILYSDELWNQINSACGNDEHFSLKRDCDSICISAKGVSAHIMDAENSVNAASLMCEMLMKCDALGEDKRVLSRLASYLSGFKGAGFGIESNDLDFGELICANGIMRMTEDGKVKAAFDCRSGLACSVDEIISQVNKKCADMSWDCEITKSTAGYILSEDNPAKYVMEDVYEEISGIKGKKGEIMAGGTYARYLNNALSIGTTAHYKDTEYPMPEGHGSYHQPDEMMSVEGFLEGIKILTCAILELDKKIN